MTSGGPAGAARPISWEGAWHRGPLPETPLCSPLLAWTSVLLATTVYTLPDVQGWGSPLPGAHSRLLDLGSPGGFGKGTQGLAPTRLLELCPGISLQTRMHSS